MFYFVADERPSIVPVKLDYVQVLNVDVFEHADLY